MYSSVISRRKSPLNGITSSHSRSASPQSEISMGVLNEERTRLQKELLKTKENLSIVVQEMIHTEQLLKQREQEVQALKSRLNDYKEESVKNSNLVNALHQTQKVVDMKENVLQTQTVKERR